MKSPNERPIEMTVPQVQATLSGQKTQVRFKFPEEPWQYKPEDRRAPEEWHISVPAKHRGSTSTSNWRGYRLVGQKAGFDREVFMPKDEWLIEICPLGVVGDHLYVQEPWLSSASTTQAAGYQADGCVKAGPGERLRGAYNMPRWASRLTLEITDVKVERLHNMTDADAIAEGVEKLGEFPNITPWRNYQLKPGQPGAMNFSTPLRSFMSLWESKFMNGPWADNPLVWRATFKTLPVEVVAGKRG